jgi:hypothetical protein
MRFWSVERLPAGSAWRGDVGGEVVVEEEDEGGWNHSPVMLDVYALLFL